MARSIASSVASSTASSQQSTCASESIKATKSQVGIKPIRSGPVDKRKRLAANARERKRMNLLNKAYDQLRKRLNDAENKSKYDVLVQAKEYIQALAKICADFDRANPGHASTLGLKIDSHEPAKPSPPNREELLEKQSQRPSVWQAEARPANLTVATLRAPVAQFQLPIESPSASSSSDCLSPMSLPDSIASSTSSIGSSVNQFHLFYGHANQPHTAHHVFKHCDSKHCDSKQSVEDDKVQLDRVIKREPELDHLAGQYHQIYHQHYHKTFFHIQKQATL